MPQAPLPLQLRRPAAAVSLHRAHAAIRPSLPPQPLPFTFSKCRCPALPLGPSPHIKGCLKLSQSFTRCLFPTLSPPRMETATLPPCPWHLQGVFCSPGHYELAVHHWPCTSPLGSALGKTVGNEAAAVRLQHPMWGACGGIRLQLYMWLCCSLPAASRNACLAAEQPPPRRFQVLHPSPGLEQSPQARCPSGTAHIMAGRSWAPPHQWGLATRKVRGCSTVPQHPGGVQFYP